MVEHARFIDTDRGEWGQIQVYRGREASAMWRAELAVAVEGPQSPFGRPGWLKFMMEGLSPEEAVAALERAVIETLAQGGQLEERRKTKGRRLYDGFNYEAPPGLWLKELDRRRAAGPTPTP
jgi:hypothetical protein